MLIKSKILSVLLILVPAIPALASSPDAYASAAPLWESVDDFEIPDCQGESWKLSDLRGKEATVIVFVGVDCPLAKIYGQRLREIAETYQDRVSFVLVDSNNRDNAEALLQWKKEFAPTLVTLHDPDQVAADALGATKNPEAFLLDRSGRIRYQGRIDDQYTTIRRSGNVIRHDLVESIDELLDGKEVTVPFTKASGCYIDRGGEPADHDLGQVTYHQHIAPIIWRRCVGCHRDGQSAPFALTSYDQVSSWLETIDEVIREKRMPPWYANQEYGNFANFAGLTKRETKVLNRWIDKGGPEGDPANAAKLTPLPSSEWNIGEPDLVISIPDPITIPATGVVKYQYVVVDPGFEEDVWVQAAEVRPSNPAIVHHCNVYPMEKTPGTRSFETEGEVFDWGSCFLAVTAPGRPPMVFPDGMAKRVAAGSQLVFQLHYQTIGSVQEDQTRLGLKFADPATVRREVATRGIVANNRHLNIPPGDPDFLVELHETLQHDLMLLAMAPHMHQRGKSCRYEVCYPDGVREILLDIPRWNFDWQDRYVLKEPKILPTGTRLTVSAVFDNSDQNPFNPDPTVTVRYGPQSTDEMFNAWYEAVLVDHHASDLMTVPKPKNDPRLGLVMMTVFGCSVFLCARRRI